MAEVSLDLLETLCGMVRPPPRRKVSEWADEVRMLSPEASAEPGKWYTSRAEYLRGIMDAVNEPEIETVVVMSSSQVGKTEVLNNFAGYYISQDPAAILVVFPTVELSKSWSKDRLSGMIRDTPGLSELISDARVTDGTGNTITHKIFPGGHLTVTGANSSAGLSARPIRIVLCDEIDRYPASAGAEGDPVRLAFKRSTTFWNRKRLLVSTPTLKHFSRIEMAYEASDKRKFFVPCPDCGEFQVLRWKGSDENHLTQGGVKWEANEPLSAVYQCEHCGGNWNDAKRWRSIKLGEWMPTRGKNGTAGFWLNEIYSSWVPLHEMVENWLESKKNPETLKTFINTSLGESYEPKGDQQDPESLMNRRENWGETLPSNVAVLTAGIDCQNDRLECELVGWGPGEESWSIDYRVFAGDPNFAAVWNSLDMYLQERWEHACGLSLPISCCAVDSGANTDAVYRFVKGKLKRNIYAIKGSSTRGVPPISRPSRSNKAKVTLFTIGTDAIKDRIFSYLATPEKGPGFCHFPSDRDSVYFDQLTAERCIRRKTKSGIPYREYVKIRDRNEALDCRVYAFAALRIVNANLDKALQLLYRKADTLSEKAQNEIASTINRHLNESHDGETPVTKQRIPRVRRRNWATGWREL